jgi:hypothetical protein
VGSPAEVRLAGSSEGSFVAGPSQSRPYRLGNNAGAACFTTSAFFLWMLRCPNKAVARAEEAIALAARTRHARLREVPLQPPAPVAAITRASRGACGPGTSISCSSTTSPLEALGTCLLGIADAQLGRAEEGLAQVNEGIVLYQEMKTPPVFWPQLLAINAAAHALAGTVAEGLVLWRSQGRDEATRCYAVCYDTYTEGLRPRT